jgi:DNA-directed RNA polymerase subunit E'/Rpb7
MSVYTTSILSRKVDVRMAEYGGRTEVLLARILRKELEGQCTVEGYVKKGSVKVLSHSFAVLKQTVARLNVVFECEVANPAVGQVFELKVVDNSRAGLKCTLDAPESPFLVFVARDHHHAVNAFSNIKEGDAIRVRVVGQRFGKLDKQISILGALEDISLEVSTCPEVEDEPVEEEVEKEESEDEIEDDDLEDDDDDESFDF